MELKVFGQMFQCWLALFDSVSTDGFECFGELDFAAFGRHFIASVPKMTTCVCSTSCLDPNAIANNKLRISRGVIPVPFQVF